MVLICGHGHGHGYSLMAHFIQTNVFLVPSYIICHITYLSIRGEAVSSKSVLGVSKLTIVNHALYLHRHESVKSSRALIQYSKLYIRMHLIAER